MGNILYWFFLGTPRKFLATLLVGTVAVLAIVVEMEFPGILMRMVKSFPEMTIPLLMLGMVLFGVVAWLLDELKTWNKKRGGDKL